MKQRILFIGSMGEGFGGVGQFVYNLCNSYMKDRYEFGFLNYYPVDERTRNIIARFNAEIYQVSRYSVNPLKFIKEVCKFYHDHDNYDIIYCNASHASVIMYTIPLWKTRNKKIVFHSHASNGDHKIVHQIFRKIVNWRVDLKLACSDSAARWMYGNRKDVQIVNNGIDVDRFKYDEVTRNELRSKYSLNDKLVFGHVGRLTPVKNQNFIIEIFSEIIKIRPESVLFIIGEGELYHTIDDKIQQMGLEDNIIMLPFQSDIQKYYQMIDIFLLPSFAEGLPFVGVEAQTSGAVTFYSDRVSVQSGIEGLAHYISLDKTAKEWADSILQVGKNEDRRDCFKKTEKAGLSKSFMVEHIGNLLETI